MKSKIVRVRIVREGSMCYVPVPFDPKALFGMVRAPVKVTLNGYTYRSTISAMGGTVCIPLRKSNREAAGLEGGETLAVKIEFDDEKREVKPPNERWGELSFTHQREYVEAVVGSKKEETRMRRIESAVRQIAARPAKKRK